VEPKTSDMPITGVRSGTDPQGGRLLVASRLATALSRAASVESVTREAVRTLHEHFDYYLAVVQRLDPDGILRVLAAAGPLAEQMGGFLALEQPVERGVNGRVARTGRPAMVNDTTRDPDYLGAATGTDPGSELSLPIVVAETNWGVLNLEQRERGGFDEEDLLLAVAVGIRMGIEGVELDRLRYGALLHDVGKIGIPAEILRKPGPLTPEERLRMDEHTAIGARMLERIPFLAPVAPLVRSAHERHDGGGYPDGLRGEEIPRGAMVISTCDAFHAMTSDRSYRKAMSVADAEAELRANAGTQFEPGVVAALLAELAEDDLTPVNSVGDAPIN
jgi:HD-GYP domain-containing protein (c-di-GMP phosphodiesterase class II)